MGYEDRCKLLFQGCLHWVQPQQHKQFWLAADEPHLVRRVSSYILTTRSMTFFRKLRPAANFRGGELAFSGRGIPPPETCMAKTLSPQPDESSLMGVHANVLPLLCNVSKRGHLVLLYLNLLLNHHKRTDSTHIYAENKLK